jgi:hypothetical protein
LANALDHFGEPGDVGQLVTRQLCDQAVDGVQPVAEDAAMFG